MSKPLVRRILPIGAALALAGTAHAQSLRIGSEAPSIGGESFLKGEPVRSFEEGHVYVVEFWGTWCPPCRKSIPHLTKLQEEHASDVTIVGVSGINERGSSAIADFVERQGDNMNYTVAFDEDMSTVREYLVAAGFGGIPTAFVVDGNGRIAWMGHPLGGLDKAVEKAVAQTGAKKPEAASEPQRAREENVRAVGQQAAESAKTQQAGAEGERLLDLMPGDPAPKLAIGEWVKGEPVSGFRKGRAYVVEFWATWCAPCIAGMPHVSSLQEKYKEDATIIGVNIWDDPANVKPFMEGTLRPNQRQSGNELMGYIVAVEEKIEGEDIRVGKMAKGWMDAAGQSGIPSAFIIDKQGRIAWIGHPMEMDEPLRQVVAETWDVDAFAKQYLNKTLLTKLQNEYMLAMRDGQFEKAYAFGRRLLALESAGKDPQLMNSLAWSIVDPQRKPDVQDLELALDAAKRAAQLTDNEDPMILDTLAVVHFQRGEIDEAIRVQTRAVELAAGERFETELRARLAEFKKAPGGS